MKTLKKELTKKEIEKLNIKITDIIGYDNDFSIEEDSDIYFICINKVRRLAFIWPVHRRKTYDKIRLYQIDKMNESEKRN